MQTKYRDNRAIGALLDEYEKAVKELIELIKPLTTEEILVPVDKDTKDEDCRSIQSILTHVVSAGFNYVIAIRKWKSENIEYRKKNKFLTADEYILELKEMFKSNEQLFADHPDIELECKLEADKILVVWGQRYNVEQLIEHAIVHILRHRRQIERFLLRM